MGRPFPGIGKGTAGPQSQADIQRSWDRAHAASSPAPAPLSPRDSDIQRGWDAAAERAGILGTARVAVSTNRALPASMPILAAGRRGDPLVVP